MASTTRSKFDLNTLTEAIERDDADAQAALYTEDATVEIVDRDHPPADPVVLQGREAILAQLRDTAGRGLTHRVEAAVAEADRGSVLVRCRYPEGSEVVCSTMMELDGDAIAREVRLQVWDA
jgi:ketosteroid isomerase-like protein